MDHRGTSKVRRDDGHRPTILGAYEVAQNGEDFGQAAAKAGMDEKTARKYLRLRKSPSQLRQVRSYRTRKDNFAEVWRELEELLEREPSLEALTLMEHLYPQYPGQFQMSQLRTLQWRVKRYSQRATIPVYLNQRHQLGTDLLSC
jgi:hypothetical protein